MQLRRVEGLYWAGLCAVLCAALTASCCPPRAPKEVEPAGGVSAEAKSTASPPGSSAPTASKEDIAPEAATGWRVVTGVRSQKHMVVAANPHASRAGDAMLRAGGSAVDAAIAMALVLTLVEPQSSGIGGGAFMLHFDAKKAELAAYDGRETAPAKATGDMFMKNGKPLGFLDAVIGGLSVGVPGELRMLEMAHQAHGKLAWKKLFEPVIALATEGFAISPRLHSLLAWDRMLAQKKGAKDYFYTADGKPKPAGTMLKNPELAEVMRQVADRGSDAFYDGAIASDIVKAVTGVKGNPGRLSLEDMKGYRAKKRAPLCRGYRAYRVCGMPPPTSGGIAALQMFGLLERFELGKLKPRSLEAVHLFAEASRLAYADRDLYVGDPDFVDVPVAKLLDDAYLRRRSQLIDPARSMGTAAPGDLDGGSARRAPDASLELPSTSHMVAVDADGNAVSMTASIESAFGSHVMVRGLLLNNELTDFSFVPTADGKPVANRVEANKRPRSSMTPLVVLDREGKHFVLGIGSPGGSRIIAYVMRATLGVLDQRLDPQQAVSLPHVVNRNGVTELERSEREAAWAQSTAEALKKLGHEVEVHDLNSGLHAILRQPSGGYVGGADPRREGLVLGE